MVVMVVMVAMMMMMMAVNFVIHYEASNFQVFWDMTIYIYIYIYI